MTQYFPNSQVIEVNPKVELLAYQCGEMILQLAYLLPESTFALHQHIESQMGLLVSGRLEMNVDGEEEVMEPLQQVYFADSNVPHGAINPFPETAFVIDVKYVHHHPTSLGASPTMFKIAPDLGQPTNLKPQSVSTDWFDVLITTIPPGYKLHSQRSVNEQMGVVLDGDLTVSVGTEEKRLQHGDVYYVPQHTESRICSSSNTSVRLIKILI